MISNITYSVIIKNNEYIGNNLFNYTMIISMFNSGLNSGFKQHLNQFDY